MSDPLDRVMQEVWDWKRQAEEATRGMSGPALIEFYRTQAAEAQREFGLDLIQQPAAEAARRRQRT